MSGLLFLALTGLLLVAALIVRRRIRRAIEDRSPVVGDELLRSILAGDEVQDFDDDEPLDEDAIRQAEDEFWEAESWSDDSEEWRS